MSLPLHSSSSSLPTPVPIPREHPREEKVVCSTYNQDDLTFLTARKRKEGVQSSDPPQLTPNTTTPSVRTPNPTETAVSNITSFRCIELLSCQLPCKIKDQHKAETSCVTFSTTKHFLKQKELTPPANLWPGVTWRSQAEIWNKII